MKHKSSIMFKRQLPVAPFIYTSFTSTNTNISIGLILLIQVFILVMLGDFSACINILIAVLGVSTVECLAQYFDSMKFKLSIESLIIGLMIGFFMPVGIGFIFVFVISAVSVFVSKIMFGGTGSNWINPVVFAICIAYVSRPDYFPSIISKLDQLKENGSIFAVLHANNFYHIKADFTITSMLNSVFLHGVGVTLPEGYISLFVDSTSVIPAFRFNIVTIVSSIFLFSFRILDYIVPVAFIASYSILVWIFGQVPVTGLYFSGDILVACLTSGVLFHAVFVMTESSSSPKTKYGKILCGILIGAFAFLICGAGSSPIGVAFAILLTNILTPLIENLEVKIQTISRRYYE